MKCVLILSCIVGIIFYFSLENDVLQNPKCLSLLTESSQKVVLEFLAQESQDWTLLTHLNHLRLEEKAVQIGFARVLIKEGRSKDLKYGKYLLSLLRKLPRNLESSVIEMLKQIVDMHNSIVKKSCETELNKISPI